MLNVSAYKVCYYCFNTEHIVQFETFFSKMQKWDYMNLLWTMVILSFIYALARILFLKNKRKKQEKTLQRLQILTGELATAKKKLEDLEQLKTNFIQSINHEIRTPLNAIIGFSEIIATENHSSQEKEEYISIIKHNNKLLLRIIDDLIKIASLKSSENNGYYNQINLNSFLTEQINTFADILKADQHLILDNNSQFDTFFCDKNKLDTIFSNLISNSLKFCPKGNIHLGYNLDSTEKMVSFYVSDEGIGISEESLSLVFEKFYKIDPFSQGVGLGLFISKTLVDQLGGSIFAKSKSPKGVTFYIKLPLNKPKTR